MSITYETPWPVSAPEDCYWYHTIDLPSGPTPGDWDLRKALDIYLGRVDYAGKRCLDVGTASGCLTFEMERRGATVTSFDIGEGITFDLIPWGGNELPADPVFRGIKRCKNGYWNAWHGVNSKANVFYGDIYHLPSELGQFDIAVLGSILLHLENPFGALRNVAKLASTIVITDVMPNPPETTIFAPNYQGVPLPNDPVSWWRLSPHMVQRMLNVLGYKIKSIDYFQLRHSRLNYLENLFCLVASK